MNRPYSKSYANRQVDLELLKHVDDPNKFYKWKMVTPVTHLEPRIVAGIEKVVQRYAHIFLTNLGSMRLAKESGNTLLHNISMGKVSSHGIALHLAALANSNAVASMKFDDNNTDLFGALPDDERILSATLKKVELKYDSLTGGRISVHVAINTAAGNSFEFIVPVSAGIS